MATVGTPCRYWRLCFITPQIDNWTAFTISRLGFRAFDNSLLSVGGTPSANYSPVNNTGTSLKSGTLDQVWNTSAADYAVFDIYNSYTEFPRILNEGVIWLTYTMPEGQEIAPSYLEIQMENVNGSIGGSSCSSWPDWWDIITQCSIDGVNWTTAAYSQRAIVNHGWLHKIAIDTNSTQAKPPTYHSFVGTGGIYGTAMEDGVVLPNCTVALLERFNNTQIARRVTDASGQFAFHNLDMNQEFMLVAIDPNVPLKNSILADRISPVNELNGTQLNDPFHAIRYNLGFDKAIEPGGTTSPRLKTGYEDANISLFRGSWSYDTTVSLPNPYIGPPLKLGSWGYKMSPIRAGAWDNAFTIELGVLAPKTGENPIGFNFAHNRGNLWNAGFIVVVTSTTVSVWFAPQSSRSSWASRVSAPITQNTLNQIIVTYKQNGSVKLYVNSDAPTATTSLTNFGGFSNLTTWNNSTWPPVEGNGWGQQESISLVTIGAYGVNGGTPSGTGADTNYTSVGYGGGFSYLFTYPKVLPQKDITALRQTYMNTYTGVAPYTGYAGAVYSDAPVYWHRLQDTFRASRYLEFPTNGRKDPVCAGSGYEDFGTTFNQTGLTKGTTSVYFNGSGLRTSAELMFTSQKFTIEFLTKIVTYQGYHVTFCRDDAGRTWSVLIHIDGNGKLVLALRDKDGVARTFTFSSAPKIELNTTYHIAVTYDAETAKLTELFINGVKGDSLGTTFYVSNYYVHLINIGCHAAYITYDINNGNRDFQDDANYWSVESTVNAYMQEVAYYNKVLTPAQIAAHTAAMAI